MTVFRHERHILLAPCMYALASRASILPEVYWPVRLIATVQYESRMRRLARKTIIQQ